MIKKISLFLLTSTFAVTAFAQYSFPQVKHVSSPVVYNYQPPNPAYPPLNTSKACIIYNQLQTGMDIDQVQALVGPKMATRSLVGQTWQWLTASGYKYALNFYNDGHSMGYILTAPTRILYIPGTQTNGMYYSYGVITPNERKFMKLASTRQITLKTARKLLGSFGAPIGNVYQYSFPNRWYQKSTMLTVDSDFNGMVTNYGVSAFCGDNSPLVLI